MDEDKTEEELFYAINRDDPLTLERLLTVDGVDPNTIFDGYDPLGKPLFWFPLHFCCEKGRLECARLLLKAGANPDCGDQWCMTPLMYAIRTEWHNMVELMLSSGASIDLQDTRGRTPLHLAVECSDDVCVKLLCAYSADVNIRDLVGRTPIWTAVTQDGRLNSIKKLLDSGCNVNNSDKRDKRTPLQEAIVYSHLDRVEYVRLLLEAGSEVNNRDEANLNSMLNLLYKCKRTGRGVSTDDLAIATMIIEFGYQLNDVPLRSSWHKYGGTAIKMAAEQGAVELVQLFLNRGADPDIPDDCGVTPLLSCVFNNVITSAIVLLKTNCRLDIIGEAKIEHTTRQVSPLQYALVKGYLRMASLLIECGASLRFLIKDRGADQFDIMSFAGGPYKDHCPPDFLDRLSSVASNPATLFDLCIRLFRDMFGLKLKTILEQLQLPSFIKRCILLEHVISNY